MARKRRTFSAEEKVSILRRHLVDKVAVSDLCDEYGLNPTVFYRWQKGFFENGAAAFERRSDGRERRLQEKVTALIGKVRASALCRPLLFCTDGLKTYVHAIRKVFREPLPRYRPGRPHLRPWDAICVAQTIKQYAQGHVVGVVRRVVQGSAALIETLIVQTQGGGVINVAYIERLNATFRSRLNALVRRGRALARQTTSLEHGLYLIGTVYNFCTYHKSLRLPGIIGGHKWIPMTPAMAARITDHRWTILELLTYHVPPPPWRPPKRRGRMSHATKQLVAQWCT